MEINKILIKFNEQIKILFIIFLVTLLFIIHTQGISLADEGYILQAGHRIVNGELLYKDFFIAYTPLSAFATAGAFLLFGESILSARLLALTVSLISILIFYKITKEITKNEFYSYVSLLLFIVWGPLHINFSWPVIYTTLFSLLSIYTLLDAIRLKKSKYLIFTGLSAGLVFFSKQNFGLAIMLAIFIPLITQKRLRDIKNFTYIFIGLLIPFIIFATYLTYHSLWPYFFENYYFFFFKKLILDGNGATPFIIHTTLIPDIAKILFYTLPLIISVIAFIYVFRFKKELIFIPIFTSLYYLTGIRPVTDLVHLTSLIAVSGLSISILLIQIKNIVFKNITILLSLILIILGFYSAIFRGYYRWESPIFNHGTLTENHRINIKVDSKHAGLLRDFKNYVDKNTITTEEVFIFHYAPSLNFIINRENPTRFIYLHPNVLDSKYQKEIVRDLVKHNVRLVITEKALFNDKSYLTKYIKQKFYIDKQMHGFILWLKNE